MKVLHVAPTGDSVWMKVLHVAPTGDSVWMKVLHVAPTGDSVWMKVLHVAPTGDSVWMKVLHVAPTGDSVWMKVLHVAPTGDSLAALLPGATAVFLGSLTEEGAALQKVFWGLWSSLPWAVFGMGKDDVFYNLWCVPALVSSDMCWSRRRWCPVLRRKMVVCCCCSGRWIGSFHFTAVSGEMSRQTPWQRQESYCNSHNIQSSFREGGKNTPKHPPKNVMKGAFHPHPHPPKKAGRTLLSPSIACGRFHISFIAPYVRERRSRQWCFVGVRCDGTTNPPRPPRPPRPERTRLARHGRGEKEKKYAEERTAQ